jgi:hypothetical protein
MKDFDASQLTYEIEIEFGVIRHMTRSEVKSLPCRWWNMRLCETPDYGEEAWREKIHEELCRRLEWRGIPTTRLDDLGWRVAFDESIELEAGAKVLHLLDGTCIDQEDGGHSLVAPIEIASPVLSLDKPGDIQEIRDVLDCILQTPGVFLNSTTGLHVHVGRGDQQFSLDALKRLTFIMLLFEYQIEEVYTKHRRSDNEYCKPLSCRFTSSGRMNFALIQGVIHGCEDKASLDKLVHLEDYALMQLTRTERSHPYWRVNQCPWDRYMAMNLLNKDTIEFRGHHGTLNFPTILRWMLLCGRLVARAALGQEIPSTVKRMITKKKQEYKLYQLLIDLDLRELAFLYTSDTYNRGACLKRY